MRQKLLKMSKTLLIYDEIGLYGTTAKDVAQFLIDNKGEQIDVRINSIGGDVFEGYAIYNNLKNTPNCTIYIDGIAASAAAVIALCGKPLKMASASQLMLHSASTGAYGNKKEMADRIEFLDSIDTTLASMIAAKLGKDVEEVKASYFDGQDHWISAQECAQMGICDVYEPSAEDRVNLQKVTACLRYKAETLNENKNLSDMLNKFKAVDAFKGCTTEDEIFAKVNNLLAENNSQKARIAELENAEKELNEMKDKLKAAQDKADADFIEEAVKDGRITDEMRPTYETLMAQDRESAHKVIDSLVKKAPAKVEDFIEKKDAAVSTSVWDKMIEGYAKNLQK